jgi:hypothetical protein
MTLEKTIYSPMKITQSSKPKKALKGTTAKSYKAPKTLEIPVEKEAQLKQTLGPKMKTKLTDKKKNIKQDEKNSIRM